ncbi:inorganic diphosphatase [Sphingomonas panaciterrae]|uniref:inorganic diphosphatase n=1 Tax=Sphingomonas panaciterrae TaxID=1462999 RepID=UPI002FEF5BC9
MTIATDLPAGKSPPWDLNVFVEIPEGGQAVKYEFDRALGVLRVDRFLHTAMTYPGNYGFIPSTLSGDGDPCDALVIGQAAVVPGCVIRARPIGALIMEDEAGPDEKILTLPVDALNPALAEVKSCAELPRLMLDRIRHFFTHYKDLEPARWITEPRWAEADEAATLIREAIARRSRCE